MGPVSSLIVIATDSLWAEIGDSITASLEPRIFTVRDERTFDVTHVSPMSPEWTDLRKFRQILTIGSATDPWVQPVLDEADAAVGSSGLIQVRDVWVRNQFVTALVVSDANDTGEALARLPAAGAAIDSVFYNYAVQRMYTSGVDSALGDSLRGAAGYTMLLPNVYENMSADGGPLLFQNSTQIGGDLVRSVLVTSREGVHQLDAAAVLAWRDSAAATHYRPPQETLRDTIMSTPFTTTGGVSGAEVQGVWVGTDPTWPSGGPFLARAVACPDQNRTFLIDAWLFAPSRSKYEYMIQLQTILGTFDCA